MKEVLKTRTKSLHTICIKLTEFLPKTYLSNHIKNQLIRCSTSVAANYRATCLAQTKASFISKISIVIEEVDESNFWLEFLIDENIIAYKLAENLIQESKELTSIFIASRKTANNNRK